jgi:hypothetical protein
MKRVEVWHWLIPDRLTGQRRRSQHRMSDAEARAAYPDAQKVDDSLEVRWLPEPQSEQDRIQTIDCRKQPPRS